MELWATIEKPDGRMVDCLLDHGVVVYPVNPKALNRAHGRFRMSASKSDPFDGQVLAEFLRTDHAHLPPLWPSSVAAQEVKLLPHDHTRLVGQQTRTLNQLTSTLKEYYSRVLDLFGDLTTQLALEFLQTYPTPVRLTTLRLSQWQQFARQHRLGPARTTELWAHLKAPQVPVPEHVVRAKARLVAVLIVQVLVTHRAVTDYQMEIERFFGTLQAAEWMQTLPGGGRSGTMISRLWAELGDTPGR